MIFERGTNAMAVRGNITIKNARILFRNFAGEERRFNPKGRRNFCVVLSDELADTLLRDGWNVRYLPARDEDEIPTPYLSVAVVYSDKAQPPLVVLKTTTHAVRLNESRIAQLDTVEINTVDLVLRPYNWEVQGRTGVKAYLKSIEVTIEEDEIQSRYGELEDDLPFDIDED